VSICCHVSAVERIEARYVPFSARSFFATAAAKQDRINNVRNYRQYPLPIGCKLAKFNSFGYSKVVNLRFTAVAALYYWFQRANASIAAID
jgi:hypothetical protein